MKELERFFARWQQTLQGCAHIAEVIGVVFLLVSVMYVGLQLRQTQKAIQHNSNIQLLALSFQVRSPVVTDEALAQVLSKGRQSFENMNGVEQTQFYSHFGRAFDVWEQAFYSHKDGFLRENLWKAWDCSYQTMLPKKVTIAIFEETREGYSNEFYEYVTSSIAEGRCASE